MRPIYIDDQLWIRPLQISDAHRLYELTDANREHLKPWMGWLNTILSKDDTLNYILGEKERWEQDLGGSFAIVVDDLTIGTLGWHSVDWLNANCCAGYWIDQHHQGRGHVTRSVHAMLGYLFGRRDLHRVEIQCAVENRKSRAIPERIGFSEEGRLREVAWVNERWLDYVVYALLESDYREELG